VNRPEGGLTTEFQNWFVLKEIIICITHTHTHTHVCVCVRTSLFNN
jgi:hypothetical protein